MWEWAIPHHWSDRLGTSAASCSLGVCRRNVLSGCAHVKQKCRCRVIFSWGFLVFFEARICPWRVDHKPAVWHAWWTRAALIEPQRASIAELLESKGIYNNVVRVHLRQAAMC